MNIVFVAGFLITLVTCAPVFWQLRAHPKGLAVLFLTEMWERFSYYGMRGLLIFYLTQQFLFTDQRAAGQYGAYVTLVYLTPLIGGIIADRYLGNRKAVMFGAILLVAGHLLMAVEGPPAQQTLTTQGHTYVLTTKGSGDAKRLTVAVGDKAYDVAHTDGGGLDIKGLPAGAPLPSHLDAKAFSFGVIPGPPVFEKVLFLALSLIVAGVGFLKSSISSIAGQLDDQGDARRDPGFTLYYFGMNLGAFWAAVLCGWLGQTLGWSYGFGAAGVGMLAGLVVFVLGRPLLQGKGEPPDPQALDRRVGPLRLENVIYLSTLGFLALIYAVIGDNKIVGLGLNVCAVAALVYVGVWLARNGDRAAWERVGLALVLVFGATVFWSLFEQAGSSLNLFAERNVRLDLVGAPIRFSLFGKEVVVASRAMLDAAGIAPKSVVWVDAGMTAAQTQAFNTGFVLLFAPAFAALWTFLGRKGKDPDPLIKFGLALIQVALGFLVLVYGAKYADVHARTPLIVLAVSYLLQTTGELCLSPIGMSQVTKLAPPVLISTLMAVWYLSISYAGYVGGFIASFAGTETAGGQVLDPHAALATSIRVFNILGWGALGVGVVFLGLSPLLKRWSNGSDETV